MPGLIAPIGSIQGPADLPERHDDAVDASVSTVAERYGAERVATLDHRHFTVVRPGHVPALTLLP
ncbi:hypothetical protein AMK21_13610 [Streptomyces sp. CB00316]|nr:hypothetical protein AMK21_13610 [Streptomyces sp. CB00316]